MTARDYLIILLALLFFIVLPIYTVVGVWRYLHLSAEERAQRKSSHGSTGSAVLGSAFAALDKVVRPSVEHTIEAQQQIVKEDGKGGE